MTGHWNRKGLLTALSLVVSFYGTHSLAQHTPGESPDNCAGNSANVELDEIVQIQYESLSAARKLEIRWDRILATRHSNDAMPPFAQNGVTKLLIPSYAQVAFTHTGDTMPPGRKKLIHSTGSTIKLDWEALPNPYSGIFATGSKNVLARFSMAAKPEPKHIIPGIALKFFIDGKESVNYMAMFSLDGQAELNAFLYPFSTAVDSPKPSLDKFLLNWSFTKALRNIGDAKGSPLVLTLHHIAEVTPTGDVVAEVNAPYSLHFVPTRELKSFMDAASPTVDFRTLIADKGEGVHLWDVYARGMKGQPTDEFSKIAKIKGLSGFVASSEGDQNLFFRHHASP